MREEDALRRPSSLAAALALVRGILIAPSGPIAAGTPGSDTFSTPTAALPPVVATTPAVDRSRGVFFDWLTRATDGPCTGFFQAQLADGSIICTPGPEPSPLGIDVRVERQASSMRGRPTAYAASTEGGEPTAALATSGIPCIGDGSDGDRVLAVYAVAADRTDRYQEIAPLIAGWAAEIDAAFSISATQVGDDRHVRFVTDPACNLVVEHVTQSYEIEVGAGEVEAVLSFEAGKGKRAALKQLTVTVYGPDGHIAATATGRSPVVVAADLPAGVCTVEVSGSINTSFDVLVTYTSP